MSSTKFTLSALKSSLDKTAIDARAHMALHLSQEPRLEMALMTMTFGLESREDDSFEFSNSDSVKTIHVRYSHHMNGESDLQIGHLDRGLDHA